MTLELKSIVKILINPPIKCFYLYLLWLDLQFNPVLVVVFLWWCLLDCWWSPCFRLGLLKFLWFDLWFYLQFSVLASSTDHSFLSFLIFFFCHFLFVYLLRCFYNLFPLSFWDKKAKIFPTCFGLSLKISLVASVVIFLLKILCHLWQNLLFYFYLNYQSLDYKSSGNTLLKFSYPLWHDSLSKILIELLNP